MYAQYEIKSAVYTVSFRSFFHNRYQSKLTKTNVLSAFYIINSHHRSHIAPYLPWYFSYRPQFYAPVRTRFKISANGSIAFLTSCTVLV